MGFQGSIYAGKMRVPPLPLMALLIALVPPSAAFAEMPAAGPDVAIIARSLDAETNTKLRDIITFAASLRLERDGLASVVIAEPPKARPIPERRSRFPILGERNASPPDRILGERDDALSSYRLVRSRLGQTDRRVASERPRGYADG